VKPPSNATNNVHRLFRESANENERGLAIAWAVSLGERAHGGDGLWAYVPLVGQATDSTMRGYLQALADDPMLPLM
jgi:hypothetical protein